MRCLIALPHFLRRKALPVAGQGAPGTPNPLASRPLRWHQAEKGHQLARIVKPPQIADFRDKGHGHSKGDAEQRPRSGGYRRLRAGIDHATVQSLKGYGGQVGASRLTK